MATPPELVEIGLMQFILPRFSLKTQVKVEIVAPGQVADAAIGDAGIPVFTGQGRSWAIEVFQPDHAGSDKFLKWLRSDSGVRAISGFRVDGVSLFSPPVVEAVAAQAPEFSGDVDKGKGLARTHCGRCHVTSRDEGAFGIGSTPSFFALRSFDDWSERFSIFYVLNPHGAFTQIKDVTEDFPSNLPSPIMPVRITLDDLEALIAYVAQLPPADLGAPIRSQ